MKVLLQAGHAGRTSGATGAPGEQKWTTEIVPQIADKLKKKGFEVRIVGADPKNSELAGDWDLFLSVHYDADIYKDRGGFVDIPDASVDKAHKESFRIAEEIRKSYFPKTQIPERPDRSNRNTKFYYMWSRLSAKTPCVIIEAGVGWRTKEDHHTLWFEQDKVVDGIVQGIVRALQPEPPKEDPKPEPTPPKEEVVCVPKKQYDELTRKVELLKKRSLDNASTFKLLSKLLRLS